MSPGRKRSRRADMAHDAELGPGHGGRPEGAPEGLETVLSYHAVRDANLDPEHHVGVLDNRLGAGVHDSVVDVEHLARGEASRHADARDVDEGIEARARLRTRPVGERAERVGARVSGRDRRGHGGDPHQLVGGQADADVRHQVGVQIDQARRHQPARGVDALHRAVRRDAGRDGRHLAILDPDIAPPAEAPAGIHHVAVRDDEVELERGIGRIEAHGHRLGHRRSPRRSLGLDGLRGEKAAGGGRRGAELDEVASSDVHVSLPSDARHGIIARMSAPHASRAHQHRQGNERRWGECETSRRRPPAPTLCPETWWGRLREERQGRSPSDPNVRGWPPMPFSSFGLHPDLLRGIKEMGFTRPTPIQQDAIPPGLQGRDVLACAMTGSGKTAAFLLPILHRLMPKRRGVTRALILTPTRELAAQIEEHLSQLAVHTPMSGAAVFGGVGIGPQEHAFRTGVDVIVATPGRLLDHFRFPYAKLEGLEILVLDEADRMLDMGFLPDIRRVLKHLPSRKQTLFFSATMPPPIMTLTRELLRNPATINLERKAAPAVGITQAVYPVAQDVKSSLLLELIKRGEMKSALVFTRTKHRANRLADFLLRHSVACERIHGNRSQAHRTAALAGFKSGRFRILVATDIAARGIDVEALSHVINFDVPNVPDDYIHRVGRTARAELTGDAFTFVSPQEEGELRAIERAIGKALPRVTLPGFDYTKRPAERLEVPIGERIAAIRAQKAQERARARANAERRAQQSAPPPARTEGTPRPAYPEARRRRRRRFGR